MATQFDPLAAAGAALNQDSYRDDILLDNIFADDNMGFIDRIRANGVSTTATPDGKGYTWYLNKVSRSSGPQGTPSNYDLSGMTSVRSDGTQLRMSYTELFLRAQVTGTEFRTSGTVVTGAQVAQFITLYQEIMNGMIRSQRHSIPFFLMGDGLMRYANYTGAGQTINAGVDGDVLVDELKGFLPGDLVTKYTAVGVSEGVFRVVDNGNAYGPGTLVLNNETGGNLTITADGYFAVGDVANTIAHGMSYLIDDGTTNSGLYNKYPREASGSPNVGVDRTSAAGARSVRARVVDAQNSFGYATLDQAILELTKIGANKNVRIPDMGTVVPAYAYEFFMGPEQLFALQQEARSTGREFTIELNGKEDMGLREGTYSGFPLNCYRCMPSNTVYLPQLNEFETSYTPPQLVSNSDAGVFQRIPGTDKYEHVRVARFHLLGKNLSGSVKIINAQAGNS